MHFKKWLLSTLSLAVLGTIAWLIAFTSQLILVRQKNELSLYLPETTTLAVKINNQNITNYFFKNLFFDQENNELKNNLNQFLLDKLKNQDRKDLFGQLNKSHLNGADFLSEFIFFQFEEKNIKIDGILCHVSDEDEFLNQEVSSDIAIFSKNNIGIVLNQKNTKQKLTSSDLLKVAQRIINNPLQQELFFLKKDENMSSFIDVAASFNRPIKENGQFIHFSINADDKNIGISGDLPQLPIEDNEQQLQYFLRPKNLAINARFGSKEINRFIGNWLSSLRIEPIEINSFSLNYSGATISLNPTQFKPSFELIVSCEHAIDVKNILSNPNFLNFINGSIQSNTITVNSSRFFYEQLDSNTFYLGDTQRPIYEKIKLKEVMSIRGDLGFLTSIETGGMDFIFDFIPIYGSAKTFINASKKVDFTISQTHGSRNKFYFNLAFKPNFDSINELFKFMLDVQKLTKVLK
jgi:hypothetical protein